MIGNDFDSPHLECIFCQMLVKRDREILAENGDFFAVEDQFPVNEHHSLIIPKRHVLTLGHLREAEANSFFLILRQVQEHIRKTHSADGFNIGVNEGSAAGQTILHLHVHVIPRYVGDVKNPRGGVRNLKPALVEY